MFLGGSDCCSGEPLLRPGGYRGENPVLEAAEPVAIRLSCGAETWFRCLLLLPCVLPTFAPCEASCRRQDMG